MTTPQRPVLNHWTQVPIPGAWADLPFWQSDWPRICAALAEDRRSILPPAPLVFSALDACPPQQTRVIILGQDPYPTPGHAQGLAFSVAPGVRPLPRSLVNIYREMTDDLGACPSDGDLRFWAQQGVLLLNTALTVPAHAAGAHAKLGWSALAEQVLARLNDRPRAALLWGAHAQQFAPLLTHPDHLILRSAHPSPLSARRGFFGSRPFSRVNAWLKAMGHRPINWIPA